MARWRRKGRVFKWAGLVVSLLIVVAWAAGIGFAAVAAAWVLSLTHEARWHDQRTWILVRRGAVRIESFPAGSSMEQGDGWHLYRPLHRFKLVWLPSYRPGRLFPSMHNGLKVARQTVFPTTIVLPMWPAALVCLAILFFIATRRGRGSQPGHCSNCGYDLTGNVSGVCPECGESVSLVVGEAGSKHDAV